MTPAEISALVTRLEGLRDSYYNGNPQVSDAIYDALEDSLRKEDPTNAFLARVGAMAPVNGAWPKVKHGQPMTSLNKAQSIPEMADWWKGCGSLAVCISEKLDGASLSLGYSQGRLIQAITRGDGTIGESVLRNVRLMQGVVKQIPNFTGCIRGEVVVTRSDFQAHFPGESNPRNSANGTMKRQSGHEKCKHLTFLAYRIVPETGTYPDSMSEFKALTDWGFRTPYFTLCKSQAGIETVYQDYLAGKRKVIDFDIDGLVLEINERGPREALGDLGGRPRAATALKFPHEQKPTILRGIEWQIGKSGRITPVAFFDSVLLAGANVKQASLHNISNIETLCAEVKTTHLRVGDTVQVSRRNDVIPFLEALLLSGSGQVLTVPTECPGCKFPLVRDGEYLICKGTECEAQVVGAVSRWAQKTGILHLGDAVIEALIDQNIIEDMADLYTLDEATLSAVDLGGKVVGGNATRIIKQIQSKTVLPLHVFVGSLGIPLIGRGMAQIIADAGFDSLHKMSKATITQIAAIPGVGPVRAEAFRKGLWAKMGLVGKLLGNGVSIQKTIVGNMTGKTMCLTGFRSAELSAAFAAAGGVEKTSAVKGLTWLVSSDPSSTSGKAAAARKNNTPVISEDDMWALLGGKP